MSEALTIGVRSIERAGLDPVRAYARLRSYTPGRGSYLFESLDGQGDSGRYSVIGYRVRSGAMMPPGVDAIALVASELSPRAESFASALALGGAGYFSSSIASLWNRVRLHDDEGPSGMFNMGATVVVFDHAEGTVSVAGPQNGRVVDRCVWELEHGADPEDLGSFDASARPRLVGAEPTGEKLAARGIRARAYLGEVESVTLAQTFTSPAREADPFDCYRALRGQGGQRHGYFIDFGETPTQPRAVVTGTSDVTLYQRRHEESEPDLVTAMKAALPRASAIGAPVPDAARLVRQLEEQSRQAWGGAVGFVGAGGVGTLVLADELILMQDGIFWCTAGARLDQATEPAELAAATERGVARRLAAIAYAQSRREP